MAVHFDFLDLIHCVYRVYSEGLGEAVKGERIEVAYAIRAATLAACERVIEIAPAVAKEDGKSWLEEMDAMGLDGYLWQKAKDGELRDLPRLSERGTVFY